MLSDPHNHAEKRRHLIELIQRRRNLKEEHARMGMGNSPLEVMDT